METELVLCPRCRIKVKYLTRAYWKREENHPGFCEMCCLEAVAKFDRTEWPVMV